MAEADENVQENQDTVEDGVRRRIVSGGSMLEAVVGENIGNIVQTSMEESIRNTIVTAGNEIVINTAEDFYVNSSNRLQTVLASCLSTVLSRNPTQQYGIGLATGWVSGYLFRKVSRTAAFIVGCGFLAAQGASAMGIITVDWKRMQSVAVSGIQRLESRIIPADTPPDNERVSLTDKIMFIFYNHIYISSGFLSGLIVGLTF